MTVSDTPTPDFNLPAYLRRIEHAGPREPSLEVLCAVHLAHATHIPFENLDIMLGQPIRLDTASLQAKLVAGGRGGYCFEQNQLLASALRAMGFDVQTLLARVRLGVHEVLPRTHMLLLVTLGGERWLADVGFGADGLLLPIPMGAGTESRQHAWHFRAVEQRDAWVLQAAREGAWEDLYAFTLEPQLPVDFEVANHYTSTHPNSRFTRFLVAQRLTTQTKIRLRNRDLSHDDGIEIATRRLGSDEEILQVLKETFGLAFAPGTRFAFVEPEN